MTHTDFPVCAFGPLVGSARSVPLYSAATVDWAFVTADEADDAADADVVWAAGDELLADELPVLLLLPQAATAMHTVVTAATVPMRLRILHTPFSIDLSPPTRLLPQEPSSGKPSPALLRAVL
ncbi:MAG TPA: hypothetical protein VFH80_06160 [Solirubrobacteraceae bacterium]|nr:hypothetical protein [Solirubrobacteraceae bacterium]